jgi:hypothetical protein
MSMGTTPTQQLLMHYNRRSFKPDKEIMRDRWTMLQFSTNKFFQFCSHVRGNFYLVATKLLGEVDGLTVGAKEFNAGRTIAKMVVEPAFYVGIQSALYVFKEQSLNIATAKCRPKQLLYKAHCILDAGVSKNDSRGTSILSTCHV